MEQIDIGTLANGPHAELIRGMAERCYADTAVQAIWVGGSLAAGRGDIYSDIDFRIAVEPGQVDNWTTPDWDVYLPIRPCGGTFLRFGENALLHHLVLVDGTIVDFYVQDTSRSNLEPAVVVLACRDAAFAEALASFATPPTAMVRSIEAAAARQFLVDYWITTHKELKGLGRQYDYSAFVGLYYERLALLRAWYMEATGNDIQGQATIHMLGVLHKGLAGKLTTEQQAILGLPTQTPAEAAVAIEAVRAEMARVGRYLAETYEFDYPAELEAVVTKVWQENKERVIKR